MQVLLHNLWLYSTVKYAMIDDDTCIPGFSWQEIRSMTSVVEVTSAFHPENYGYRVVRVALGILTCDIATVQRKYDSVHTLQVGETY